MINDPAPKGGLGLPNTIIIELNDCFDGFLLLIIQSQIYPNLAVKSLVGWVAQRAARPARANRSL